MARPCAIFPLVFLLMTFVSAARGDDPLRSWNECPSKSAIIDFVQRVTTPGSKDFTPEPERIAVFDNDGTLWPENPLPFQVIFALDDLRRQEPEHPEWKEKKFLQAALNGEFAVLKRGGIKAILELLDATHSGITTDEYSQNVRKWLQTARHPRFDRPYNKLAYQPMLELLAYLRQHQFKTYIVSGGGADFMRVWAEGTYGIPPSQIVGSVGPVRYEIQDGTPLLIKEAGVAFVDDKAGKPVGIHRQIGRRPLAAFGNSDGDKEMLEWTTIGHKPSFGLIVHHTDAKREYAYDKDPKSSGKLVEALAEAPKRGWVVVDMKNDWKRIFEPDETD